MILEAVYIFVLRVVGISINTIGTVFTVQGRRLPAILAGSANTLIYILAIGQVVSNLSNVWNVVAYVAGFAVGTWVGMMLEGRIALGYATVRVISTEQSEHVAAVLREAGFGATHLYGQGRELLVGMVEVVVPRKQVSTVIRLAEEVDREAIVTVSEVKAVQRAYWKSANRP